MRQLILVYAVPRMPPVPAPHGVGAAGQVELERRIRETAEKALGKIAEKRRADTGSIRHRGLSGEPACQIGQAAEAENADPIVMSTHGETGWRRFASGPVAEKVVRLAQCPVLSVRGPGNAAD